MKELKQAWEEPISSEDVYTRFHVAKERLKMKYRQIQKQTPKMNQILALLQAELENLKYSSQDPVTLQEITSLKSTTALIRDLEFTRAFRRTRRSKVIYLIGFRRFLHKILLQPHQTKTTKRSIK